MRKRRNVFIFLLLAVLTILGSIEGVYAADPYLQNNVRESSQNFMSVEMKARI